MFLLRFLSLLFFFSISTESAIATNLDAFIRKARTLEKDGFLGEAVEYWQELASMDTNTNFVVYAKLKLGSSYLKLKQFQKSIEVLKAAATSHPENFDLHFSFANSLSAFKNFTEAIKSYKKSVILKPKEGLSYVGLGLSFFGSGDSENAIKSLLTANKLFKEKKNISWYRDTRVMIAQIKHFAKFPPHFSNLWLTNNLKLVHDTYEKKVFNPKLYLPSQSVQ
ncbi:uncharacterized protein METZ01_LOCUS270789 [marine metagenome]|uniref:Uncharacterized protein n=1 Tax=marine metagenome TaxID=408172 RepID=A0A382K284_9ZZZZ